MPLLPLLAGSRVCPRESLSPDLQRAHCRYCGYWGPGTILFGKSEAPTANTGDITALIISG